MLHTWEKVRNACNNLVGKPEWKRPLVRSRHRRDDIRMDLRVIWCESVNWIYLAQNGDQWQTLVNMVMNLQVP